MTRPPAGRPCWKGPGPAPAGPSGGEPAPPSRVLGVLEADVTVVGAGLAGLSTAYHLAERDPSLDVLVVDAEGPAAGASGRGTGLLGPRVGPPVDQAVRRFGPDTARRMHTASVAAVEQVLELCARLGVAASCRTGEQVVATRTADGLRALSRQAAAYRELGLDVPVLSAADLRDRVDVPYHAGLLYRAATLDPAALTGALARACAAEGVRFLGNSPLLAIRPGASADETRLVFAGGTVRTRKAVLAVNAAAGALGLPVGTVLPLLAHAIATAPLPAEAQEALGGRTGCALIDAHPMAPYFRLAHDGRLVLGGGRPLLVPVADDSGSAAVWRRLEERLRGLHPVLAEVEVTHRWAGQIGMTTDGLPVVGPLADRPDVWYVGGCCGHGLAMSVAHGAHVAGALTGDLRDRLPWHRSRAPRLPLPGPARPLLSAALGLMERGARRAA
ncbi:FAD-binding oxidoreductase [Streptomyces somaliensis DSM 40738]|uniref:FAD-binding oxidoreductase n=1 Tax=Streptomyces somaliensis (strain ATCC 33201 / DSM 40738 / JCM 12659 / KCTC 9044 / NCTC 11332 / NRRL B-12077 / IP 733) TaxID=1134445 RepID=A0AA44ICN0_STRE0|nr:FAD-binding oxidoreductase [Streptomyces somaliensis]MCQ0023873.1 FAD-binding oxidoreductase [Streptomyces somaliensis DSM 40738]NKY13358.1 FAD-binding oxidoreductase [Streptomyces somaliensis DSM 40738]